jgi:hypothetical protein
MARILIGALSGWKHYDRRRQCRDTWMHDAQELGVEAFFLMGCPTANQPELIGAHTLILPCPDDYNSLPQRTMWFCRWALARSNWDYLFKCDDDTYISVPRLALYDTAGRDYIGNEWKPRVGYASGGAGYFLSRKAAQVVADRLTMPTGAEDLEVGRLLQSSTMKLCIDPRFQTWGDDNNRPKKDNDIITLHGQTANFMASHLETGLHAAIQ